MLQSLRRTVRLNAVIPTGSGIFIGGMKKMAKKFGEIELGGTLGGYEIINQPADKLPQDLASAISIVNSNPLLGATYNPLWLWGKQPVNGVNYLLIAEDIRTTKNKDKSIVGIIINIPPGEGASKGEGAKIVRVIDNEKLDEEVELAFTEVTKELKGMSYKPVMYLGKQPVNGINYLLIAEDIRTTKNKDKSIVGIIINIPPGEGAIKGEGAKIVRVIDNEKLSEEVELAFTEVTKELKGMSYKPVMYLGKQTVRGENHYILCEAKVIYPGAQPYAIILGINIFEGKPAVVSILPLSSGTKDSLTLFGYAFTW